jgi:acyl-CoA synthetase (AMP-forming)/AMP-acid ligase II
LIENARSIIEYLKLGPGEAAALSLPLHYSYGLSILNSHLLAGGSVMLTEHSFMRPEFWREAHEGGCTSFSGVPYMYETLQRLRVDPLGLKHLRTLTQAGGHLRPETVNHFATGARARGGRFFVMYGQTEATARIAYVPPERLAEKVGSIGVAVPRGEIWLAPVDGAPDLRQIIYRGPNVMLGYALSPSDLAKGDEHHGILATGDLAEQDEDGFFRITGRLARFAKLFGKRINLSDVEVQAEIGLKIRAAALDGGDCIRLMLEGADEAACTAVRGQIAGWLGVPPLAVRVSAISQIPLTSSGKKDYKALR